MDECLNNNNLSRLYNVNKRWSWIGDKNVWVEIAQLAIKHNAVNLGQVINKHNFFRNKRSLFFLIFL